MTITCSARAATYVANVPRGPFRCAKCGAVVPSNGDEKHQVRK